MYIGEDIARIREIEERGFIKHNAIHIVELDTEHCVVEVALGEATSNHWGAAHGGLVFSLADSAAGILGRMVQEGANVTTDASIQFFRSTVEAKKLTATSRVCNKGNHLVFLEVDITDETGTRVASSRVTMYYIK